MFAAYAIAIKYNKEVEFVRHYGIGVYAEGRDVGTDRGLQDITDRVPLPWNEVRKALDGEGSVTELTAEMTERNRLFLATRGLWGVPCIGYKDMLVFGQDKLWIIEQALIHDCDHEHPLKNDTLYKAIRKYCV